MWGGLFELYIVLVLHFMSHTVITVRTSEWRVARGPRLALAFSSIMEVEHDQWAIAPKQATG